MKNIVKLIPVIALGFALTACETSDDGRKKYTEFDPENPRIGEEVNRVCRAGGINGFGETTRNTVVVTSGVNRRHLLKVAGGCFNLKNAQSIKFNQFSGCLSRGDSLLAFENTFGPSSGDARSFKCIITNIYKYNKDAPEEVDIETDVDADVETNEDASQES